LVIITVGEALPLSTESGDVGEVDSPPPRCRLLLPPPLR
jgi:hypothetical protein